MNYEFSIKLTWILCIQMCDTADILFLQYINMLQLLLVLVYYKPAVKAEWLRR